MYQESFQVFIRQLHDRHHYPASQERTTQDMATLSSHPQQFYAIPAEQRLVSPQDGCSDDRSLRGIPQAAGRMPQYQFLLYANPPSRL